MKEQKGGVKDLDLKLKIGLFKIKRPPIKEGGENEV
ncbi:unnamed protein product, partial [marine sediment metagenome]